MTFIHIKRWICAPLIIVGIFGSLNLYGQFQYTKFIPIEPEILSNSFVRNFYKDSYGYMWIGTADGLIKYDGTGVSLYEYIPRDSTSISHNSINAVVEDADHNLWIGTANGLCLYNRERDNFTNVDSIIHTKSHLNSYYISALSFDGIGKLWVGTLAGGINVYDPIDHSFTYLVDSTSSKFSVTSNYVTSLLYVGDRMWVGTKGGLKLYNAVDMKLETSMFVGDPFPKVHVSYITTEKNGNIWLTTIGGEVFKFFPDKGNFNFEKVLSGSIKYGASWNNILTLSTDNEGNLWIGGDNSGLNYLDNKTNEVTRFMTDTNNSNGLLTNSIRSVYRDDDGLTWIGTYNKGAYLIDNNSNKFRQYQLGNYTESDLLGSNVRSFAEDRSGDIWIAFDGVGLVRLNSETNTLQDCSVINKKLSNKYLTALIVDKKGNLWVGTVGDGVYKIDVQTQTIKNYPLVSNGFGDNKVFCLYEDKEGTIWSGTSGSGLFYFDQLLNRFVILSEKKKVNSITSTAYVGCLTEDSQGVLWVGTMYGLYALNKIGMHTYEYLRYLQTNHSGSISSSAIHAIFEDKKNNLWIGTADNGLNLLNRETDLFSNFQKVDGLSSNKVRTILDDDDGNLWVSGSMGLSKFNPKANTFTSFTLADGLASNNFYHNAGFKSSTGKLFFGSNSGFIAFYPDSIRNTTHNPKIYLTDLKIDNQSVSTDTQDSPLKKHISLTEEIELSYDQRSFRLDFAAIGYNQSLRPKYCYKLEGFDKNWNCVESDNSATYTNLDPGSYTFLVKASYNNEVWSEAPNHLKIKILPVFWKTWWAISIYVFGISLLIFFLIKVRVNRVRMENRLLSERLAREREHELSESKTQFFTNISHEFRTPLSLIAMPLENLIAMNVLPPEVKERLGTIRVSANKMMRLVNELMDFSKLENQQLKLKVRRGELIKFTTNIAEVFKDLSDKKNIHFGVHPEIDSLVGWFDHDKLEKIIVNVLSNAFKFTAEDGEINVIINRGEFLIGNSQVKSNCLELVIVDNGIGISSEELPFIFDKFYQAKSSAKVTGSGTGIGLSFTKGLIELHHGSIQVKSIPDDETRFLIHIPIDREVYCEDEIHDSQNYTAYSQSIFNNGSDLYIETDKRTVPDTKLEKSKILIVEDNDELRDYIAMELQNQFKVMSAKNGAEGIKMASEKGPDLIISDVLMPLKSGIELCREIKTNLKTCHIPIILLTAKSTIEDQITGISTGADVYVTKPFSIRYLIAHINQIIESRQQLYSRFSQDVYLLPNKVSNNQIDQEFLQRAIDYVMDNITDSQMGVDSIANLFNLSRMQTYRKIKALTGKSVVDFIRMVRMKQALQLMEMQKYTLTEIAYQTGFNSSSYFTRCFKDQYGKTPSEYLKPRH